jgi:hypothetical protein
MAKALMSSTAAVLALFPGPRLDRAGDFAAGSAQCHPVDIVALGECVGDGCDASGAAAQAHQPPALSQRSRVDDSGDADDAIGAQAPVPAVDGAFGQAQRKRYRGEGRPRSNLQCPNDSHIVGLDGNGIGHYCSHHGGNPTSWLSRLARLQDGGQTCDARMKSHSSITVRLRVRGLGDGRTK